MSQPISPRRVGNSIQRLKNSEEWHQLIKYGPWFIAALITIVCSAIPFFFIGPAQVVAVFEVIIIITSAWLIILVSLKSKHKIFAKCLIIVALVLSSGIIYSNFFESPDSQSNTSSLGETVFTHKEQNDLINRLDWSPDGKRITSY